MSYSRGGQLKGKSAPLKLPDMRISMVGHDSGAQPIILWQIQWYADTILQTKISISHIQNPYLLTFRVIMVV